MNPALVLCGLYAIGLGMTYNAMQFGAHALDEMLGDFKLFIDPILKVPIRE